VNPFVKGLIIAVIHVCLVSALGAKLLYDRATLPRVWVKTAPYDPNLPIRGRYVSLRLVVEPRGTKETKQGPESRWHPAQSVRLRIENEHLLAIAKDNGTPYNPSGLHVRYTKVGDESLVVLDEPVAFFIPEHIPDPSRRPPGEQLWVEVTVPKKGVPRPVRLGATKDNGPIAPLDIK
jgi:hypothetical protein